MPSVGLNESDQEAHPDTALGSNPGILSTNPLNNHSFYTHHVQALGHANVNDRALTSRNPLRDGEWGIIVLLTKCSLHCKAVQPLRHPCGRADKSLSSRTWVTVAGKLR